MSSSIIRANAPQEHILREVAELYLTGEDGKLPAVIGYFMMWFGIAEMNLTRMLAHMVMMKDLQNFELLVKGMDARQKCERIRKAGKVHTPVGPELQKLINRFEKHSIPLRNRISHSWPVMENEQIHFCSVGRGIPGSSYFKEDGTSVSYIALFEEGLWLNEFSTKGIISALLNAASGGPLEVDGENQDQQ